MNRNYARKIAKVITNEEMLETLTKAKNDITDWSERSDINQQMSKGYAWNMLAKNFDITKNYSIFEKYSMLREYGKYVPEHLKIKRKKKPVLPLVKHDEPNFDNFNIN